jgi:hypothetical protein
MACGLKLVAEREREDFRECVSKFNDYIHQVGGAMNGGGRASFRERRLLDKLMYFEGHYLEKPK